MSSWQSVMSLTVLGLISALRVEMTAWLYRNFWLRGNGNVAEGPGGRGTVCTVHTVRCT